MRNGIKSNDVNRSDVKRDDVMRGSDAQETGGQLVMCQV